MGIKSVALIEHVGGYGGMDYYDYGLAYGLGLNNITVSYHTCNETNMRIFNNVDTNYTFGNLWKKNKVFRFILFFRGYLKSFYFAKNKKIQLVHLHFFHFTFRHFILMFLSRLFSFKVIITVHDIFSFFNISNRFSEYFILKWADGIIVHNQASLNDLMGKHPNLSRINVIHHGNYLPFINKIDKKYNNSEHLKILFFGQIKEIKGLDILLEALKIANENNVKIHLTIAGKPSRTDFDKYAKLIDDYSLIENITLILRYIDDSEIQKLYEKSDLIVLPYKMISQSGVLLLSMSYGLPALTSDLPAFTEIITDNSTGFTFETGNPQSLANKLIDINNNRSLLQKITVNSNKLIESKFDWKRIGEKTKKFYEEIVNK
mgnify:FL=1